MDWIFLGADWLWMCLSKAGYLNRAQPFARFFACFTLWLFVRRHGDALVLTIFVQICF